MKSKRKCPHCGQPIFSKGQCKTLAVQRYAQEAEIKKTRGGLANGTEVVCSYTHKRGIIVSYDPEAALYYLNTDNGGYERAELKIVHEMPVKIGQYSDKRQTLAAIYDVIRAEFLSEETLCGICNANPATEIHHKGGREGYLLIMSAYFLPVCNPCHKAITEHSRDAIINGYSISRAVRIPFVFSDREIELMAGFGIKMP